MNRQLHRLAQKLFLIVPMLLLFPGNAAARIDFASVKPVKEFWVKAPDGVNISVQEWGNPDGPEIIFIHGFLQSHLSWWKQVTDPVLAKKFRMITFDLPGHGGSDKPCDPAVFNNGAHYADTLNAVITASGLKKPVLVGWSYGTRIVCDYLTKYGDSHIRGINFVGSAVSSDPRFVGPGSGFSGGVLSNDLVQSIKATREFDRSCFHTPPSAADLDQLTTISMMVPSKIRQWMKRLAPYEEALKAIKVPVLVTHGVEDQIVRLSLAKYVVKTVPHAQASFYKTVGHSVFWEAPSRFNRELAAFVQKVN
jgi:non-heme chloroperoxidase